MAEALARGSRITGTQRAELAAQLGRRYAAGESIRAIAEDTGRSFGFVHGLVKESGVDLRGRGGATRGPAARSAAAGRTHRPAVAPLDGTTPPVEQPAPGGSTGEGKKGAGKAAGKLRKVVDVTKDAAKPTGKKDSAKSGGKAGKSGKAGKAEKKPEKKKAGKKSGAKGAR